MTAHTFLSALQAAEDKSSLPSWIDYEEAGPARQQEIRVLWCAVGHGYEPEPRKGDREKAFNLYCRAQTLQNGPAKNGKGYDADLDFDGDMGRSAMDDRGMG